MDQELVQGVPSLGEYVDAEQTQAFDEVIDMVREMCPGVRVLRDEKLVRGLDYYNGTCFEFKLDSEQPN